ncbi:hypothetical protein F4810DRAFT_664421 [Camillea tinctor]|nr:hypothetical protein F4810DRAFT_664421 [Camillea tinctor]
MASIATTLGLRAASPPSSTISNHAPGYLIFHFVFAYGLLSSRTLKQYYGIDHNASPREDLDKYGDEAVKSGKITNEQLAMLRRNESAHANAVENYTLFVAAMSFATITGVEREYVNRAGLIYTMARVAYGAVYILIDHPVWSQIRGITWWTGNLSCLWLLWRAWSKLRGAS